MTDRGSINGLSHVVGRATDEPLLHMTIPAMLDRTVEAWPTREAAIFPQQGIRWTWTEFAVEIDRLASGLVALGTKKGDRVGIWSPNRDGMAAHPVRHGPHWGHSGLHQSRLSQVRA